VGQQTNRNNDKDKVALVFMAVGTVYEPGPLAVHRSETVGLLLVDRPKTTTNRHNFQRPTAQPTHAFEPSGSDQKEGELAPASAALLMKRICMGIKRNQRSERPKEHNTDRELPNVKSTKRLVLRSLLFSSPQKTM